MTPKGEGEPERLPRRGNGRGLPRRGNGRGLPRRGNGRGLPRLAAALEGIEPRPLRGERFLRTGLRTLHILAFGVYFGGQVFGVEPERLVYGLVAVVASGGAFAAFEVWRAPVWLLQLRGTVTFLKLLLLVCVGIFWELRIPLLVLISVLAVASSHMPGRYRYYSPFLGRVLSGGHKG